MAILADGTASATGERREGQSVGPRCVADEALVWLPAAHLARPTAARGRARTRHQLALVQRSCVGAAEQRGIPGVVDQVPGWHAQTVQVACRGGDAVVHDPIVLVDVDEPLDPRPEFRVIELVQECLEDDLALALDQEVDLGTADRLVREQVNMWAPEHDFCPGVHLPDELAGEDHVDQGEGHGRDADHVELLLRNHGVQLIVAVLVWLRVDDLDRMDRVLFEIAAEHQYPERRIETPVLLDDRRVLPDQFVEAWRVDQQYPLGARLEVRLVALLGDLKGWARHGWILRDCGTFTPAEGPQLGETALSLSCRTCAKVSESLGNPVHRRAAVRAPGASPGLASASLRVASPLGRLAAGPGLLSGQTALGLLALRAGGPRGRTTSRSSDDR